MDFIGIFFGFFDISEGFFGIFGISDVFFFPFFQFSLDVS